MANRSPIKVRLEVLEDDRVVRSANGRTYRAGDILPELLSLSLWLKLVRAFREQNAAIPVRVIETTPSANVNPDGGRPPEAMVLSTEYLLELLKDGPVPVREGLALAAELGLSERTLYRARGALGVKSRRRGFGPGSVVYWHLPNDGKTESQKEG